MSCVCVCVCVCIDNEKDGWVGYMIEIDIMQRHRTEGKANQYIQL